MESPNYKSAKLVLGYWEDNHLISGLDLFMGDQNRLFEPVLEICQAFCGRRSTFCIHITVQFVANKDGENVRGQYLTQSNAECQIGHCCTGTGERPDLLAINEDFHAVPFPILRAFRGYDNIDLADRGERWCAARAAMGQSPAKLKAARWIGSLIRPFGLSIGMAGASFSAAWRKP